MCVCVCVCDHHSVAVSIQLRFESDIVVFFILFLVCSIDHSLLPPHLFIYSSIHTCLTHAPIHPCDGSVGFRGRDGGEGCDSREQ
jgi:hypothetical protein